MNAAGAILIVSVGITAAYFLFLSLKTDERQEQKRTDTIMRLLSGEVIDVYDDKETGLSSLFGTKTALPSTGSQGCR